MSNEIGGGPFREVGDPNAQALENMHKKIETEGMYAVLIQENTKIGNEIPGFAKLIKKYEPRRVAFYSVRTGILKYASEIKTRPAHPGHEYAYENRHTRLWIQIDKKASIAVVSNLAIDV